MKILVTNDDGIAAEGLKILTEWAMKLGDVTVVAPKSQQSAVSQAVNLHTAFEVLPYDYLPGVKAWTVDSTPADCVRYADAGLGLKFDLVFSGINKGWNVGWDISYSATCGAAYEAVYSWGKAVAFSTDFETDKCCGPALLDMAWDFIVKHRLLEKTDLINVNLPVENAQGVRITRQAGPYYKDNFTLPDERHLTRAVGYSCYKGTADLDLDLDCVKNGYISVTPLSVSHMDWKAYEEMKGLSQ